MTPNTEVYGKMDIMLTSDSPQFVMPWKADIAEMNSGLPVVFSCFSLCSSLAHQRNPGKIITLS